MDIFRIYGYFRKKQLKNANFYYTIKKNYNVNMEEVYYDFCR